MTNLISVENVEEFGLVRRLSRSAITTDMLAGIRRLHETKEIEPFLRAIIFDTTQTPHGSMEVADILTTHVTYGNRPRLAAFVNKGRSTPQVRLSNVGHQVLRLGSIPNIDLMVLLAVGDIQDDIKASLLQLSQHVDSDCMIVDARDVARLFIAYQKVCPKDGTPFVDGHCPTCGATVEEPVELTIKLYEDYRWELLSRRDVSHANAKRYTADVLTDPHYSKTALREVVKEAVWELRHSTYYRSSITEAHFGDRPADCIFLFVYLDLRDVQQTNWTCRAQWIRADLPERESLLPEIESRVARAAVAFEARRSGDLGDIEFDHTMSELEAEARNISRTAGNDKLPPVECQDADSAFQRVAGMFHNIFVPFGSWVRKQRDWRYKEWHVRTYPGYFEEERQAFLHEWRKIR